ncbi:NAD(+)/NADH kinase [Hellea sp.]|nr:NAD(+)/NADH kinase [Hellea sp.]
MLTFSNIAIIINAASGSTSDISEEICAIFKDKGCAHVKSYFITPDKLVETFETVIGQGADLIVSYGGDGTSLCAASLAGDVKVPIITLPGGTMNLLPKSLYSSVEWRGVLDIALKQDKPRWVPCGLINEHKFLVAAMLGTIVRMSHSRELFRDGQLIEATKNMIATVNETDVSDSLIYSLGDEGERQEANLLQLTCPGMNDFSTEPDKFEVAAVNIESYGELSALGLTAIMDHWRENQAVSSDFAQDISVHGSSSVDILLDGEHVELTLPLSIKFEPKGAFILCPPPQ